MRGIESGFNAKDADQGGYADNGNSREIGAIRMHWNHCILCAYNVPLLVEPVSVCKDISP